MPDQLESPQTERTTSDRDGLELRRQTKYRLAQSVVFGLPVITLHAFGRQLGGPEAGRWVGLLEGLLAGWVMYVGAFGWIGDALWLRRRVTTHLIVGIAAIVTFLMGGAELVAVLFQRKTPGQTGGFFIATALVIAWSAIAWMLSGPRRAR